MNETNWINTLSPIVTESDRRALAVAKKQEKEKIKQGYRWVKINARHRALVPCDKQGKPTKEGLELIEIQKEMLAR